MKMRFAAAVLCAAGLAMPAVADDADDVKAAIAKAQEAYNACDVDSMKGLTRTDFFGFDMDGTLSEGNDMAEMKAQCDAGTKADYNFGVLKVDVRGNVAVVAGSIKGTVTPKEGEAQNVNGKFSAVFVKDGDAWKTLHVHSSPNVSQEGGGQ